jgi:O-antigen/teichoic acid export membrane protein
VNDEPLAPGRDEAADVSFRRPPEYEELPADGRRRIVRAGTLATLGFFTSQALAFISFIVLARLAPPATFGAYAAASILLGASALFSEAGMQAAVVHWRDKLQAAASTAFLVNMVGGLALAVLAAASAPLIGLFFHSHEVALAAAVLAGVIPLNAASIVPAALLQRRVSFRPALLGPVASFAYGVSAIAALASGLGLWGLVLATYAAAALRTIVVWALSHWRPSFGLVSWEMWWSLGRYGRPVVFSMLLREVGIAGSIAFVGRAFGTGTLGNFRYAQRLVMLANTAIVFGSAYVLLPAFSRNWHDKERFQNSILSALRILSLLVFPVSLIFVPLGRPFATILFGEEWRAAGPIMMALAGVGVALALDSISSEAFKATGRTDLLPRMHGLTATIPLALMVPLVHFGAVGIGLAMSLGMLAVAVYAIRALGQISEISLAVMLIQIRPAFSGAVLMAGAVFLLDHYIVQAEQRAGLLGFSLLMLDLLAAGLLYIVFLLLLSRRSVSELKGLAKLVVGRVDGSETTLAG